VSDGCIGYYYLHVDGKLLFKRELPGTREDLLESTFVTAFWPVDPSDRECAWRIILDSQALGAPEERIRKLADKWGCGTDDAEILLKRLGLKLLYDAPVWLVVDRDFVEFDGIMPIGSSASVIEAIIDFFRAVGGKVSTSKCRPRGIIDFLKERAANRGTI
jgi:hypothetical protein